MAVERLTNCTYCPREPNAIPFPPRQVTSLTKMFVEFYRGRLLVLVVNCGTTYCWCPYPFDRETVVAASDLHRKRGQMRELGREMPRALHPSGGV